MKSFINHYRTFRNHLFEECGDMEEDNIILLYSLYIENKHTISPFASIEKLLAQFSPYMTEALDPDDDENDDDPFASNTSGA
jgi:hypothetical protein|tara:strand:+ start:152 stop:397 length:246 start_codon:yes stop_codon:yes gene_type:complete